jgi:NAD(P)-dependent dehydrogenase (short-subunit alcohol dehydrogenase family)
MAKEWAPKGIRVNAIAPGPFDTDMMAATLQVPEFYDEIVDSTLFKRIGRPEEIAGAALLLASDAGSFMTGSVIVVDGGLSA